MSSSSNILSRSNIDLVIDRVSATRRILIEGGPARYHGGRMPRTSQPNIGRQVRRGRVNPDSPAKHPVIDNRKYPSTEEVGRILNVPANRIRRIKDLAAKKLRTVEALS